MKKVKVHIISGFLGAGKTTLMRKLLAESFSQEKVVIIENEFGEVNIDSQLLQGDGIAVREISAGCICCSLAIAFSEALETILQTYNPDRILIEPTGVAKISAVLKAIAGAKVDCLEVQGCATVVCGETCMDYIEGYGEFFEDQIAKAAVVLVNQMETLTPTECQTVVETVRKLNPEAPIITAPWADVPSQQIVTAMETPAPVADLDVRLGVPKQWRKSAYMRYGRDRSPFSNWTQETAVQFKQESLAHILTQLSTGAYGKILRAKGIVQSPSGWLHFDYTPAVQNVEQGQPAVIGMVCVIGERLDREKLKRLFETLDQL
ncbi:GTP-binding protein [Bengtsoniella intestinalis]|uniref:CobW family GTP-binding protein n=1 Tax=Bengtsoniella intestinalis TaxID=3073143 RepID=UPI00391F565B